jgi:predicted HicB family RNase H-like nuclease
MAIKNKTLRIPDEVWVQAIAAAAARGETLTKVVTAALRRYIKQHTRDLTKSGDYWQDSER